MRGSAPSLRYSVLRLMPSRRAACATLPSQFCSAARIAAMVGLSVNVPQNLVRRPKAWLNLITRINPQLGVREIR